MVGLGLDEAMPLAFLAPDDVERAGVDQPSIVLTNPLAAEESVLRPSLRPGLLKGVRYNQSHRNGAVGLFEIGKVFRPPRPGQALPDEREVLGLVRSECDALGAVEAWTVLVESLRIDAELEQVPVDGLHPGRSAVVRRERRGDRRAGRDRSGGARLARDHAAASHGSRSTSTCCWPCLTARRSYRPVSRYPSSDIDLAFVVPDEVPAAAVRATITASAGDLLTSVRLFDVFRSDGLGADGRSLAFTLRLQASDRTLTDDEVAAVRARVIAAVESAHGATLRG